MREEEESTMVSIRRRTYQNGVRELSLGTTKNLSDEPIRSYRSSLVLLTVTGILCSVLQLYFCDPHPHPHFISFPSFSCGWRAQAMAAEFSQDHETSNGWPLGLQTMTMRLGAAPAMEPYSLHIPSSSFSSFSSSNLDTESSASFFQDSSVSLGKLIGLGPGERGALHLQNTISTHQSNRRLPVRGACNCKDVSRGHGADTYQGICIPLVLGALLKISSNRMKSKPLD
ncbi:hypothetical protein GQ457_03G036730 [Hibiscus cannabinus]